MKKFKIKYSVLLLILWGLFGACSILSGDRKGAYIFMSIGSFPISGLTQNNLATLYLGGAAQWLTVGWLLDGLLPAIKFEVRAGTIEKVIKFIFGLSILGLILSALTITNGYTSSIIYNISMALMALSIGYKIIFLSDK